MVKAKLPVYLGPGHDVLIAEFKTEDLTEDVLDRLFHFECPDCRGPLIPDKSGTLLFCSVCRKVHGLAYEVQKVASHGPR